MEVVKQLLTEAGVIGRIVDDFDPLCHLDVIYGDKRVSLGDQVSPAQVQHRPHHFEYFHRPAHPQFPEILRHGPLLAVVMTDLDAAGGEYLHWLSVNANAYLEFLGRMQWQDLVTYEAPRERRMGTRKIVFTLFASGVPRHIILPQSRKNFSTSFFADTNALGPPLAAAFFKIIDLNWMTMEVAKQLLTEAGVIGGIVGDFDPQFQLDVIYGHRRICLGDQVFPAEVNQRPSSFHYFHDPAYPRRLEEVNQRPSSFHYFHDPAYPRRLETSRDPTFVTMVMMNPDAPGGQYLHWLCRQFIGAEQEQDMPWEELLSYEAPREGTRKIVCTAFKTTILSLPNTSTSTNTNIGMFVPNIIIPESRNYFNTRDFASTNALGPPLAASFFRINNQY